MKVKELLKGDWKYKRIRIKKICNNEDKDLEGREGILTTPFVNFKGVVGVWLDKKYGVEEEICNLFEDDEVEIIK